MRRSEVFHYVVGAVCIAVTILILALGWYALLVVPIGALVATGFWLRRLARNELADEALAAAVEHDAQLSVGAQREPPLAPSDEHAQMHPARVTAIVLLAAAVAVSATGIITAAVTRPEIDEALSFALLGVSAVLLLLSASAVVLWQYAPRRSARQT